MLNNSNSLPPLGLVVAVRPQVGQGGEKVVKIGEKVVAEVQRETLKKVI